MIRDILQPEHDQDNAVNDAGGNAEHKDGTGNDKHFRAETCDKALAFEFHCRGDHGIGKAGNGYQRAGSGMLGNLVVPPKGSEKGGNEYQADGHCHAGVFNFQPPALVQLEHTLPHGADQPAKQKRQQTVLAHRGIGRRLFDPFIVLLL